MTLKKQLGALFSAIMKEAEANPEFAESLQVALGTVSAKNAGESRSNRRVPAVLDPFEVYGKGASVLRDQLAGLDIERLRDVVAQYGMDRSKLAMKWKDKDRLIELILSTVASRITKGDAFRAPATQKNSTKVESDMRTTKRSGKSQIQPAAESEGAGMTDNEAYGHTFPIVFSYTAPLITPRNGVQFEIGAGVFIQVGGRYFIATAAHCMKERAVLVNERRFHVPPDPAVTILNRGANWDIDVGFLEIKHDERFEGLRKSSCTLGQLGLRDLPKDEMFHVVGYPNDEISHQGSKVEIVKRGFGSSFQEREGEYLLLPFPNKGDWFQAVGAGFEKSTFHDTPRGFSGGGLWAFNRVPDGEMFVPEKHIKLMGIQSAWWVERRLIKCVPIMAWLRLIHDAYPDLRPDLEAKCPSLAG